MKYVVEEKFRAKNGHTKYLDDLAPLAKQNRHRPTLAEKAFWHQIKNIKPQFLRQKPISRFILDFYCSKLLLDVEIDGDYHQKRRIYDEGREEILYTMGIKTIRFSNEQVLNNIGNVMAKLEITIKERTLELVSAHISSTA